MAIESPLSRLAWGAALIAAENTPIEPVWVVSRIFSSKRFKHLRYRKCQTWFEFDTYGSSPVPEMSRRIAFRAIFLRSAPCM